MVPAFVDRFVLRVAESWGIPGWTEPVWVFLICAIALAFLIPLSIYLGRKDDPEEVRFYVELAESLGLRYLGYDDSILSLGLERLPLFRYRPGKWIRRFTRMGPDRVIRGTISGRDVVFFRFTGYDLDTLVDARWVLAVRAPQARFARFSFHPDGVRSGFLPDSLQLPLIQARLAPEPSDLDGDEIPFMWCLEGEGDWLAMYPASGRGSHIPEDVPKELLRRRFDQGWALADAILKAGTNSSAGVEEVGPPIDPWRTLTRVGTLALVIVSPFIWNFLISTIRRPSSPPSVLFSPHGASSDLGGTIDEVERMHLPDSGVPEGAWLALPQLSPERLVYFAWISAFDPKFDPHAPHSLQMQEGLFTAVAHLEDPKIADFLATIIGKGVVPSARRDAITALQWWVVNNNQPHDRTLEPCRKALENDEDIEVRKEAAYVLGEMHLSDATPWLRAARLRGRNRTIASDIDLALGKVHADIYDAQHKAR